MKVTVLVGGRWHSFELAAELAKRGLLHRIITTYPTFKTAEWDIPSNKVVSIPLKLLLERAAYRIGGPQLPHRLQGIFGRLFARAAVRHLHGSEIIHGWSSFSEPAMDWAKRKGIPFVLERGSSHIEAQSDLLTNAYANLGLNWEPTPPSVVAQEVREYQQADCIVVPSSFVYNTFRAKGVPADRLLLNPFGADVRKFQPGERRDEVFRVLYVGTLSVRKGIHDLVAAFMQANIPNSELCLVGGATPETPRLLAEADHRVRCIGHLPQAKLIDFYQDSAVFVMPSIEEGMAMVQLQAQATGLPLICTRNTGGEDLLKLGGPRLAYHEDGTEEFASGYMVSVGNSAAIARLLTLLARTPELLGKKRQAALALRERALSWEHYADRCVRLYGSLHSSHFRGIRANNFES
ncbi:Alpha-monoglucosyldiacylglycerol synthase [compost metagenome]